MPWVLILSLLALLILIRAIPSELELARRRTEEAKYRAEEAAHEQKIRLAKKETPIEVAAQVALMQAEADIQLATAQGNAEKVLEFTRKKYELQKQLQ